MDSNYQIAQKTEDAKGEIRRKAEERQIRKVERQLRVTKGATEETISTEEPKIKTKAGIQPAMDKGGKNKKAMDSAEQSKKKGNTEKKVESPVMIEQPKGKGLQCAEKFSREDVLTEQNRARKGRRIKIVRTKSSMFLSNQRIRVKLIQRKNHLCWSTGRLAKKSDAQDSFTKCNQKTKAQKHIGRQRRKKGVRRGP